MTYAALGFPGIVDDDDDAPAAVAGAPRSHGDGGSTRAAAVAPGAVPTPKVNGFNGPGAFDLVRLQVQEYGERPAGSPKLRALAERLRALMPRGRLEAVPGHPGLQNVIGTVPGRKPAIVVAAHYDTKDEPPGFVGAEDAAGGTAAVVTLARAFARAPKVKNGRELRFVLFDGEEAPANCDGDFYSCGVRGSKAYASANRRQTSKLILLDFVAQKGVRMPRELGSDVKLWAQLRRAATRVGVSAIFPSRTVGEIQDDHTPFARAGIPAIDLIDFDYPYWHTAQDTLDKLSPRSLDASGEAVYELVRELRRG